jgi:hypothetical protein
MKNLQEFIRLGVPDAGGESEVAGDMNGIAQSAQHHRTGESLPSWSPLFFNFRQILSGNGWP